LFFPPKKTSIIAIQSLKKRRKCNFGEICTSKAKINVFWLLFFSKGLFP